MNKAVLHHLPPIWTTALRRVPAGIALWLLWLAFGRLVVPVKADVPVILSVGLRLDELEATVAGMMGEGLDAISRTFTT